MFEGGDSQNVRYFQCNEKGHIKANFPLLKNEKNKDKEPEKMRRSFRHGMRAAWGHSEDEISSNDEEMHKPICFMAIGEAAKIRPIPIYSENMCIDEDMFKDIDEAYDFMLELIKDMIAKLRSSKRVNEKHEDDKEQPPQDVS